MAALSRSYIPPGAHLGKQKSLAASFSSSIDGGGGTATTPSSLSPYLHCSSGRHFRDGRTGQSVGGPIHPSNSSSSSPTTAAAVTRGVSHVDKAPTAVPDDQLRTLESFRYVAQVQGGTLEVRPLESREDVDGAVRLLLMSFSDAWWNRTPRKVRLQKFWVQQYVERKKGQRPHATTLVGFYRVDGEAVAEPQLACTAEVWFDERGASDDPPEPVPPRGAPYICNMTVNDKLRRRRIGWHLLEACEKLITKMCSYNAVYLHCRVRNKAPLGMYKKAGYMIVNTDSLWVLARFKHRKHLICKQLRGGCIEIN
ncbi:hypothetical protein Taro_056179 [Colocasia esculenta]|uniref:N-acetyltransferase domain-containing protein n=1 Tax=Colocasia esculenta TaxID=4460 RepID=A0A843XWJ3_COLES|nr:hypothetical protein [Colocasia esculenta]